MAINANIALQGRGVELPDPVQRYGQMQQLMAGQDTQRMNAMKMQEAERGIQNVNAMNRAYSESLSPETGQLDYNMLMKNMAAAGQGSGIPGVMKQQQEGFKAQGDIDKTRLGNEQILQARLDSAYRDVSGKPTDANLQANYDDIMDPKFGYTAAQKQQATSFYEQLKPMTFEERMAALSPRGSSAGERMQQGTATANREQTAATALAGQQSTAATALAGQNVTRRGQDMTAGTALAGQQSTANTAALNAGRTAGQLSAAAEKVKIQNKQAGRDIALAISEITEAIKPGGLLEKSTGSGIGRLYDVSAGFFGNAPAGAIAIGQLQPVADLALKMVPRFEGPQSDKDVLTYRQASGELANPNLPTEIRKRAAQAVLRIMKARKDQFTTEEGAATGAGAAAAEAGGAGVDSSNPLLQ